MQGTTYYSIKLFDQPKSYLSTVIEKKNQQFHLTVIISQKYLNIKNILSCMKIYTHFVNP